MPVEKVNVLKGLIDWYAKASPLKKMYIRGSFYLISAGGLIWFYDNKLQEREIYHNSRYDVVVVFYTSELAKCNSENKAEYRNLLEKLSQAIAAQKEAELDQKRLDLEFEKLK